MGISSTTCGVGPGAGRRRGAEPCARRPGDFVDPARRRGPGRAPPHVPLGHPAGAGHAPAAALSSPATGRWPRRCSTAPASSGWCSIQRGFEVGGGDARFDAGTVARGPRAAQTPDGQYALEHLLRHRASACARAGRPTIPTRWPGSSASTTRRPGPAPTTSAARIEKVLRRILAVRSELGDPVDLAQFELHRDPAVAYGRGPARRTRPARRPDAAHRRRSRRAAARAGPDAGRRRGPLRAAARILGPRG